MNVYMYLYTHILIQVPRIIFPCSRVVASHSPLQKAAYVDKMKGSSFLAAIAYIRKRYNK